MPPWMRVSLPHGEAYENVRTLVRRKRLNTVCEKARCPNIGECWSRGTATFILLGECCTRHCRFCAVHKGKPVPPDPEEPRRLAQAVVELGLGHVAITSVTRDDLADGGASYFAATIREMRMHSPECTIEVLVPDFQGSDEALEVVLEARPDVLAHNLETVPRLYPFVRPQAEYRQSLQLLERSHAAGDTVWTKSGLMLGLGESDVEIREVLQDLADRRCRIVTMGQYCSPGKGYLPVARFVSPDEFEGLKQEALAMGFTHVEAGPLVRSSYRAEAGIARCNQKTERELSINRIL